jgi:hypothetical protein
LVIGLHSFPSGCLVESEVYMYSEGPETMS